MVPTYGFHNAAYVIVFLYKMYIFTGEVEMCVTSSVLYGMVSYCVITTLMLSMAGIKVARRLYSRHARSSEQQQASVPTPGPTPVPTPVPTGQEAILPALIDLVPEQLALQCQDQDQDRQVIRNSDLEVPFQLIMSNILRSQNRVNNPFNV
jgi:hypothetical protein